MTGRKTMMVGAEAHGFITELSRRYRLSTVVVIDRIIHHVSRPMLEKDLLTAQHAKRKDREANRDRRAEARKIAQNFSLGEIRKLESNPELIDKIRTILEDASDGSDK